MISVKVTNGLHIAKHNGQLSVLILSVDYSFLFDKLSSLSHKDAGISWFLAPSQCPLLLPPFLLTSLSWIDPMLFPFSFLAALTPSIISTSQVWNVICYKPQIYIPNLDLSTKLSTHVLNSLHLVMQQACQIQDSESWSLDILLRDGTLLNGWNPFKGWNP